MECTICPLYLLLIFTSLTNLPPHIHTYHHSCLCQRFHCDTTCDDMCMECTPEAKSLKYLIPLEPYLLDAGDTLGAHDDNNFGDGIALNGRYIFLLNEEFSLTSHTANKIIPSYHSSQHL